MDSETLSRTQDARRARSDRSRRRPAARWPDTASRPISWPRCFLARSPKISCATSPPTWRRSQRRHGHSSAARPPGHAKVRLALPSPAAGEYAQGHFGDRDRQRRHAVPGRLGPGGACRPWRRDQARRPSGLHRRARRHRPPQDVRRFASRSRHGAQRESFIHIHVERIDDAARTSESSPVSKRSWPTCASALHDWRAMRGPASAR